MSYRVKAEHVAEATALTAAGPIYTPLTPIQYADTDVLGAIYEFAPISEGAPTPPSPWNKQFLITYPNPSSKLSILVVAMDVFGNAYPCSAPVPGAFTNNSSVGPGTPLVSAISLSISTPAGVANWPTSLYFSVVLLAPPPTTAPLHKHEG